MFYFFQYRNLLIKEDKMASSISSRFSMLNSYVVCAYGYHPYQVWPHLRMSIVKTFEGYERTKATNFELEEVWNFLTNKSFNTARFVCFKAAAG